jgi:hypothetical protein
VSPAIVYAGLLAAAGFDDGISVYNECATSSLHDAPRREKMSSSAAGIRDLSGLMRSLRCKNSPQKMCPAASAGVHAECTGALQLVATLQQQCLAVEQTYSRLKQLRVRLATARGSSNYKKASRLLHTQQRQRAVSCSGCSSLLESEGPQALRTNSGSRLGGMQLDKKQQRLQLVQCRSQPATQQPSLPALTVVARTLLQLAELQASPAVAAALRHQLLQQIKAAAAAARFAGQPFSVAVALHDVLPGLRAAVRTACSQAVAAAVSAAAAAEAEAAAVAASMESSPADAAATLEKALSAAAEEVQQLASMAEATRQQLDGSSRMVIDMDALLQEEITAALSTAG